MHSFEMHSNENVCIKMDVLGWNKSHDIINPPKREKKLNIHYSPILHGCMNVRKGRAKFKNFHVFLDSGCSSTIVMGIMVKKLGLEEDTPMQWNTQAGNVTNNLNVKIYITIPAFSAINFMMCNCHVDDSA